MQKTHSAKTKILLLANLFLASMGVTPSLASLAAYSQAQAVFDQTTGAPAALSLKNSQFAKQPTTIQQLATPQKINEPQHLATNDKKETNEKGASRRDTAGTVMMDIGIIGFFLTWIFAAAGAVVPYAWITPLAISFLGLTVIGALIR